MAGLSIAGYIVTLVNQLLISYFYGTSAAIDAYWLIIAVVQIAFFYIGPAREAFIPEFHSRLKNNPFDGYLFFSKVFNVILITILISFIIAVICPESFAFLIVSKDQYVLKTTFIRLLVLMSPIILLFALTEFLNGILISYNNVLVQNASRVLNAGIMGLCIVLLAKGLGIYAIIIGSISGQIAILMVQIYKLLKNRFRYLPFTLPAIEAGYIKLFGALLLAHISSQIYTIIEKNTLTTFGNGVVSSYQYGFSLTQVPQMVFITSLSIVLWPEILDAIHKSDFDIMWRHVAMGLKLLAVILGFVMAVCVLFSEHIVYFLFYRGAFDIQSLEMTSHCFRITVFSLFPAGFTVLLNRVFISLKSIRSLMAIGICASCAGTITILVGRWSNRLDVVLLHLLISSSVGLITTVFLLRRIKSNGISQVISFKSLVWITCLCIIIISLCCFYPAPQFKLISKWHIAIEIIPHVFSILLIYTIVLITSGLVKPITILHFFGMAKPK